MKVILENGQYASTDAFFSNDRIEKLTDTLSKECADYSVFEIEMALKFILNERMIRVPNN